jgi:hypothetical protein
VGFFDVPPPEPDDDEQRDNDPGGGRWLLGALVIDQFVGWSDQAAVAVRDICMLPDSFEVDVTAWLRRPQRGHGPARHINLGGGRWESRNDDGSLRDEFVRFGVQFPDGGRVTNLDLRHRWPDATEPVHGMTSSGGSTSASHSHRRFSLWPIPESGDIVFVCEWPAYGIAESRLTVDGDELRAAAARSRPVWPDEPRPGRGSDRPWSRPVIDHRRLVARISGIAPPDASTSGEPAGPTGPAEPGPDPGP